MTAQTLKGRVLARLDDDASETGNPVADLALEDMRLQWLEERATYLTGALPTEEARRDFMQGALMAMTRPGLKGCDGDSLLIALMQCAHFGLTPDGTHAAIVRYDKTATFIPMYMGYIELMIASGHAQSVAFNAIHENDQWFHEPSAPPARLGEQAMDFLHRPKYGPGRGEPMWYYAFAWLNSSVGLIRSEVMIMSKEEILDIRDRYSKAWQRAEQKRLDEPERFAQHPDLGIYNSPWHTDEEAMCLKTVVRRLPKRVSTSPRLRELMRYDVAVDPDSAAKVDVPKIVGVPNLRALSTEGDVPELAEASPERKREWLISEIDFMAKVGEVDRDAARATIAQEIDQNIDEADVEKLFEAVAKRRASIIERLREQGETERADYYRFAMESGAIARIHVLLGMPEPHAFVASSEDPDLCAAEGCGLYEDEALVHGGP
jgi:recombination protein RecT